MKKLSNFYAQSQEVYFFSLVVVIQLFSKEIMVIINIKKNLCLLLPKHTTTTNLFDLVPSFSCSSSASAAPKTLNPSPKSNPMAEYLINSCGFSSQKAASATKLVPKSTSIDQARSVRHFFEHHGFGDARIRKLISNHPRILSADVDRTLQPSLHTLREMGFVEEELRMLVASNPSLLVNPSAIPRLEFWQAFLRTRSRRELVSAFWRNPGLIAQDVFSGIAPKIALLMEHGLSETDIAGIVKRGHGFIKRSAKSLEELLMRAEELGFDPKYPMFGQALSLGGLRRGALEEKMELFKGLGWSEEEFHAALKKAPFLIRVSKENVLEKMDFLVARAGCEQSYISSNPVLLMFSLEKRLKPRHYVLEMLKSNEIFPRWGLYAIMCLPERKFVESFILPYKERAPKIHGGYIAACAGQIPT